MAVLEKIRSKSVLLLVIIGAALIAFIIGDFFTSGRTFFGTGTTVAKAGNQKIDIQEFQTRMEQANQQYQQSGQKIDHAVLQQNVLNSMLAEKLFREELNKLGLKVTDKELSDMMLGANSAYMDQMVQQQFGVANAATLYDMAFNPAKYGLDQAASAQLQQLWMGLESQMEQQLLEQKFMALLAGTITANELDAQAIYNDGLATSNVVYVTKDYSTLSDNDYPVSSEDIHKEWEKNKKRYAINEQLRRVNYINVPIEPSQEDIQAGEKQVEDAIVALNTKPDTEGVVDNNMFVVNRQKTTKAAITDNRLKSFVDTTAIGKAALISRAGVYDFTLGKLIAKTQEPDSINVDVIAIADTRAAADSIVAALNAGTLTLAELDGRENMSAPQIGQQFYLLDMTPNFKETFVKAPVGEFFIADTTMVDNYTIAKVNKRNAPVDVYDVAVVTYTIEPSNATINKLRADLQNFINENATAEEFLNNAAPKYQALNSLVSASTPQLANIPDTRNTINWAMSEKKGKVSPIFGDETTGQFIVVALQDIYDDYMPVNEPQTLIALTNKVRNDKKAAALIEQYQGKANDIAGYSKLMESQVDTTNVNFLQPSYYFPQIGGADVVANIAVAKPGQVVGPLQGLNGVVVFDVIGTDNQGRPYNYDENAAIFNRTRGAQVIQNNLHNVLLGNGKIKNNLLTFFKD